MQNIELARISQEVTEGFYNVSFRGRHQLMSELGHPEHMVSGLDKGCAGFDNGAPPRNGIGLSRPAAKKEPETPKSFAEREP